jgi:hypothetical protein
VQDDLSIEVEKLISESYKIDMSKISSKEKAELINTLSNSIEKLKMFVNKNEYEESSNYPNSD